MSFFGRVLSADECAVVVKRGREPRLVTGPASVRTFWRWRRVVVVDRTPFAIEIPPETVIAEADVPVTVSARVDGQVVDPVAAALKVVDYKDATRTIARTAIRAVVKDLPSSDLGSRGMSLKRRSLKQLMRLPEAGVWPSRRRDSR